MVNFRTGADTALEASKSAGGGGRFARVDYFRIPKEDKESHPFRHIRFVTDMSEWITVKMHNSQRTRSAPPGYQGKWPSSMGAVCRKDSQGGQRTFPDFADCYFCDEVKQEGGKHAGKPIFSTDRTWGLGIERVEDGTKNPDGTPHLINKMQEVKYTKEDGTVVDTTEPVYLLFVQSYGNFWSSLHGLGQMYGTVLDRDFRITRIGWGLSDTDYQFGPHNPQLCTMGDGSQRPFDFRDADIRGFYDIPDLGELVLRQASDDYYDRFFDIRHPQPVNKGDGGSDEKTVDPSAGIQTPSGDVPADQLQTLMDRVQGIPGVTQPVTQPVPPVQQVAAQPTGTPFRPS